MISPIEDIIEEAREGRPFVIVDAEDRENEGDVIIPAQFATPSQINFMAMHARGLICIAMTEERAQRLRLSPMAAHNGTRHSTAFTVSIEAREGVTTGISAHDRAHTVAVAIDPERTADDIVSPGHVFPLVARGGGVLVRAGHTEAAVDIARLAGLIPAGVICEVMNDDGSMARLPELIPFAERHNLKIGTITDLIQYRRRTERSVERVIEVPFESEGGHAFRMIIYRNLIDGAEHVALLKGRLDANSPALVRVHSVDLATDLFRHAGPRADFIPKALKAIGEHDGPGVMLFLRDSQTSWSQRYKDGLHNAKPSLSLREYGVGAQILRDLGVHDMVLLSASAVRMSALDGYGLRIVDYRMIDDEPVTPAMSVVA
ncbi:3,4-dihydroxy-2-butanone-4-phosphate synthase [Altererythrobacter sp. C41]|uniref:3,4-dihydroxy-2-butanone-4-phosphate synthase n=1 Tax=Altererythrobacter sp. C41 TaxID=2806021 RepID=UPI00193193B4|nr:3,4-dihydroxy-2-butanone-4-phosphate synthase [Altererythrobacter sp. C41]MBM0171256.1 3,4-dihydroxy-2-butanone-4-phosphate synthase [Altererythrobacter sp. C41]